MSKKRGNNSEGKNYSSLEDHVRRGKRFNPPMVEAVGDSLHKIGWMADLVPEVLWVALLVDALGPQVAIEAAHALGQEIKEIIHPEAERPLFCAMVSDFAEVPEVRRQEVRERLSKETITRVVQVLGPLFKMYPDCPMSWLASSEWAEVHRVDPAEWLPALKGVVRALVDRGGMSATVTQVIVVCLYFTSGGVELARGVDIPDFNAVMDYPHSDESRRLAATTRAMLNSFAPMGDAQNEWAQYFWRQGMKISVCDLRDPDEPSYGEPAPMQEIVSAAFDFAADLERELKTYWDRSDVDLAAPARSEVMGGLLARQARLAAAVACDPALWAPDVGQILLRCMVDTHILAAWLARCASEDDFARFVEHGLGQEKLVLLHLREVAEERGYEENVRELEAWLESQMRTELLPIDIGYWASGRSTRALAEEAGCLDVYRLQFAPLSAAVHGSWGALARLNLQFCRNPLHRYHRVPLFEAPPLNPHVCIGALNLLTRTYQEWCTSAGVHAAELESVTKFLAAFESIINSQDQPPDGP